VGGSVRRQPLGDRGCPRAPRRAFVPTDVFESLVPSAIRKGVVRSQLPRNLSLPPTKFMKRGGSPPQCTRAFATKKLEPCPQRKSALSPGALCSFATNKFVPCPRAEESLLSPVHSCVCHQEFKALSPTEEPPLSPSALVRCHQQISCLARSSPGRLVTHRHIALSPTDRRRRRRRCVPTNQRGAYRLHSLPPSKPSSSRGSGGGRSQANSQPR